MAGCGFRLPQFSEETAWLPPWLQPDQFQADREEVERDQTPSSLKCTSNPEILRCAGDIHYNKEGDGSCGDGTWGSFHLYLSGEGNSSIGSILPSKQQASPLDLHLSSEGISQFASEQCSADFQHKLEAFQSSKPHPIVDPENGISGNSLEDSVKESSPLLHIWNENDADNQNLRIHEAEAPEFQNKVILEDKAQEMNSEENCVSGRFTSEVSPDNSVKMKQNVKKKTKRKRRNVCDVEDSIELCIAASEAVAISDMATEDMLLELFPASSLLEVAIRVKQARIRCQSEHAEDCSDSLAEQIDETHLLYDLDDADMENAFDDAGMICTQVVLTPDDHCNAIAIDDHEDVNCLSVGEVNVNCSNVFSARDEQKIPAMASANALDFQNSSTEVPCSLQNEPSHNQSISTTLNRNNQSKDQIDESIQSGIKDTPFDQVALKEDTGPKDKKIIANLFMESSYISESLDYCQGGKYIQAPETGIQIVESMNSVVHDKKRSLSAEGEISAENEILCSPSLEATSDFASVDPLCSMVPCSISSDDVFLGDVCGQKSFGVNNEHTQSTTAYHFFQSSSGHIIGPGCDEMPSTSPQLQECNTSMILTTKSCQAKRTTINSLKAYSMVVPLNLPDTPLHVQTAAFHPPKNAEKQAENDSISIRESDQQQVEPKSLVEAPQTTGQTSALAYNNLSPRKSTTNDSSFFDLGKPTYNSCSPRLARHFYRRRIQASPLDINNKATDTEARFSSVTNTKGLGTVTPTSSVIPKFKGHLPSHASNFSLCARAAKTQDSIAKRVRFSDAVDINIQSKHATTTTLSCPSKYKNGLPFRTYKRQAPQKRVASRKNLKISPKDRIKQGEELALHGLEFLLTGFSRETETKVENLIRILGGIVLQSVPPPPVTYLRRNKHVRCHVQRQIVLAQKKVRTTAFLYGCAINALILSADWLHDSFRMGSMLSPEKYLILPNLSYEGNQSKNGQAHFPGGNSIFAGLGVMLYGKTSFCSKYENIIKHGGGQVFKTLHWLVQSLKNGKNTVGVILAEDENDVSRHLKHCALEQYVITTPASWIEDSLFTGKLLPLNKDICGPLQRTKKPIPQTPKTLQEMSQEI